MNHLDEKAEQLARVNILIHLRWILISAILLIILLARFAANLLIPVTPIIIIFIVAVIYNLALIYDRSRQVEGGSLFILNRAVHIQLLFDIVVIVYLVHFTGGIESPFLLYFVFNIITTSMLLPAKASFLHTTFTLVLISFNSFMEKIGFFPHFYVVADFQSDLYQNPGYIGTILLILGCVLYLSVYLTTYLADKFRMQQKELSEKVRKLIELDGELKESYFDTVRALAQAVDAKDPYTQGHCDRVTSICMEIAKELGLSEENTMDLRLAAELHDIGKIGIPESILTKKGKLTKEEYDIIKKHPEIGEQILKPVKSLKGIRPIILHHQERYDGKGYPDGLKGGEIPFLSRIIALADAYDAMTSDRPHRKAFSPEYAVKEVKDKSGIQFDPLVVDAFLRCFEKGNINRV